MLESISLKGKAVAVTGCTGGLGRELCFKLAKLGASIIMLDRNPQKSLSLANELRQSFSSVKILNITTELEDINSVKGVTEQLLKIKPDIFVHNAGAYSIPRHICTSGYDNVFQINFLSPYYIIRKLTEAIPNIKVVAVGSIAHTYSKIDESDVDFRTRKSAAKAYGNAKRFLILPLHEYFKSINSTNIAIVHPGITFTNITAHYPPFIFAIIKHPMKIIFMKPKKAVLSILEGVFKCTPFGFWIGPKYFDVWGKPAIRKIKASFRDDSKKAFLIAEKLYKSLI